MKIDNDTRTGTNTLQPKLMISECKMTQINRIPTSSAISVSLVF